MAGHRAVGYIRVSTDEQADSGAGLTAQREAIEVEAARRQWQLVNVFQDAGMSGKGLVGRDGLQAALVSLEGGEADALIVAKLDRLSRSIVDFAALMDRSRRKGWQLVALDLGVDTTTPAGELMAGVVAQFAHYERRLIGQRTKEALAVKRAEGVRLGRPPTMSEAARQRIIELRGGGASLRSIADLLNREGVPTAQGGRWHVSTVRYVLAGIPR